MEGTYDHQIQLDNITIEFCGPTAHFQNSNVTSSGPYITRFLLGIMEEKITVYHHSKTKLSKTENCALSDWQQ